MIRQSLPNWQGWATIGILVALQGLPALYLVSSEHEQLPSEPVATTAQRAARYCISHTDDALQTLRTGQRPLALSIRTFQPPQAGSGALQATLVAASGRRHELGRVVPRPMEPTAAEKLPAPQVFLLQLADAAPLLHNGQPLCVELGFTGALSASDPARAEFSVALAPLAITGDD